MSKEKLKIMQAVARGWRHPETEHKVMDIDLVLAITEEILAISPKPQELK